MDLTPEELKFLKDLVEDECSSNLDEIVFCLTQNTVVSDKTKKQEKFLINLLKKLGG